MVSCEKSAYGGIRVDKGYVGGWIRFWEWEGVRLDTTERASSRLRSEKDDFRVTSHSFFARLERSRHVGYRKAFNRSSSLLNLLPRFLLHFVLFWLGFTTTSLLQSPYAFYGSRKEPRLLLSSDYHHSAVRGSGRRWIFGQRQSLQWMVCENTRGRGSVSNTSQTCILIGQE